MHSFEHVIHGIIFGVLAYFVMVNGLHQDKEVAQDRSILLTAVAVGYMVLFGHGLPNQVNKNIF